MNEFLLGMGFIVLVELLFLAGASISLRALEQRRKDEEDEEDEE